MQAVCPVGCTGLGGARRCFADSGPYGFRIGGLLTLVIVALLMTAPRCHAQTLDYDALGRLTRIDYGNGNAIDYSYDAAGNRLSQVEVGTAVPDTIPQLAVDPVIQQISALENVVEIQVVNAGGGTLEWSAAVTSGSDWLSITAGGSGTGAGTVHLLALANPDTLLRAGVLRITAPGAEVETVDVTLQQAGADSATDAPAPSRYRVRQNVPNPFNPRTTIRFALPEATVVDLTVYDQKGRRVRTLLSGRAFPAGEHAAVWDGTGQDGRRVAAGVYFYRFSTPTFTRTRAMALVK